MEGYISEIRYFGGNFAPLYWQFCQGQLLSIAENTALFSLIGTIYGGDGQVTFALPNMAGRIAVGTGQGPGLPNIDLGELSGTETATLTNATMPLHNHTLTGNVSFPVADANGNVNTIAGSLLAGNGNDEWGPTKTGTMIPINANMITGPTGGGQPISVVQPYLVVNAIICVEGIYPSRN